MAGLFDKQAEVYIHGRPTYPSDWYAKLAALTPHHSLAWDVGTGNGQAAIGVSPFFPFPDTFKFGHLSYLNEQLTISLIGARLVMAG